MRIHHIGIAVESLRTAVPLFAKLLGRAPDAEETIAEQKMRVVVFALGESRIELLEAASPDSPIARFLSKRGQGIHHVALAVANVSATLVELERSGFRFIDREPRIGAGRERIAFLHPSSTAGVLIELVEENKNRIPWVEVGDEPCLLASRLYDVPVMVSKNRYTSGAYVGEKYGSEILVLDDGFQHWRLSRDLDILVIDSTNPFGNSKLFPAGILREPLSSLKRADILVLTKSDQISNKLELIRLLRTYNQDAPMVESVYKVNSIERWFGHSLVEERNLQGKKSLVFSGIGNPVSFEKSLEILRVEVLKHHQFPDHFFYQKKDILNLEKEAGKLGADFMITTEKDSVRIPIISDLEIPIYVLKIDLVITEGEEIFWKRIEELIKT